MVPLSLRHKLSNDIAPHLNRNRLILAIKQHGSTGAGAPIMMSRTTRAGLRLQRKNNLGFSELRRLGFCSIKSIIKQTRFLNAWIDCCRHSLERSYTVSQINATSVQAYRTRAQPSGGTPLLPWDWSRGEYASPLAEDRHLRNRENQAHHAGPARKNQLVVRGECHEDVRGQSTHAGIRAQHA